jgi:prevent-host-death family protein
VRTIGAYTARTHLSRLLDDVAKGETITITKRGVPVALLVPALPTPGRDVATVIAELRAFRKEIKLEGVSLRYMIDEGRY